MPRGGHQAATHLVPLMRYRDVGVASEWLCAAFGFEPHFAAKAPDGAVFYAELRLGDSMIMLGPTGEPSPDDRLGGALSSSSSQHAQSCYVVLEEVDDHYERAKRAGATMTLDLKSDDLGGRGYSCHDLEGHTWNFGTYDPFKAKGTTPRRRKGKPAVTSIPGLKAAIGATVVVSMFSGWLLYGHVRGDGLLLERLREALLGPRAQNGLSTGGIDDPAERARQDARVARREASSAHRAMAALKQELEAERQARAAALQSAEQAQADRTKATVEADAKAADAKRAQGEAQKIKADAEAVIQAQAEQIEAERLKANRAETERIAALQAKSETDAKHAQSLAEQKPEVATASLIANIEQQLAEARAAKDAAVKAAADAERTATQDRQVKDSALQALADAGARIATLEVELKTAKVQLAQAQAAQLRRLRSQVSRPKAKKDNPNESWPYSEW